MTNKVKYQSTRMPEYYYSEGINSLLESFYNIFAPLTLLSYLFTFCILFLFLELPKSFKPANTHLMALDQLGESLC